MIGRISALLSCAALAPVALGVPAPAGAQCRLCPAPTTTPEAMDGESAPLRLEVRTTLDFDRLILHGAGAGSALLNPDGTSRASGSVTAVSGRAVVAQVLVRGEPGRAVRIDLPDAIELYGLKGGSIRIDALSSDLPSNPVLDGNGELKVRIGGELKVSGDLDGDFRGDVPVIVDYL